MKFPLGTVHFLEIPANGKPVMLRYGQHYQVENGKVIWVHTLLDLLDLMRQVGGVM